MKKIFLITKLRTTNIGNEALSSGIIELFKSFGGKENLAVNGRPMGLDGYYPGRLSRTNPDKDVDRWASRIVKHFQAQQQPKHFKAAVPKVILLSPGFRNDLQYEGIKKRLRPLKRFINSFFTYKPAYQSRLNNLASSDVVVYSGAGEVGDNNVFLRQLVELRVAQMLGISTAAVNQSVVIKTDRFKKLVGHVYGKMEKIVVRGETSKQNLVSYGVPASIIEIAPDTAINTPFVATVDSGNETMVGINFTPRINIDYNGLKKIIDVLRKRGFTPVFVTNDPNEDAEIRHELAARFGVVAAKDALSFQEYSNTLHAFRFLISTRLHSNILALNAGTPVIPIEGNVFKTTELLQQLKYPLPVINAVGEGWEEKIIAQIETHLKQPERIRNYIQNELPPLKRLTEKNASWV